MAMQDQQKIWDDSHTQRQLKGHSTTQTSFAEEIDVAIPAGSSVLELGCGEGNDSIYFAQQGHKIVATDFSPVIIESNAKNIVHQNLEFRVQDISKPFDYPDGSFDVIYARLSLHYFTDKDTRAIFTELGRVLKPGGLVCFMCKSVDDGLYGQGIEIEPDMFELHGHVRHFFSQAYARELLTDSEFEIVSMASGEDVLYTRESAFITVIARSNS